MTVKELAEFTGKTERTVQRWAEKAAMKHDSIDDIMSQASPSHPADYPVNQVEMILNESRLGQNAVMIIMENARRPRKIIRGDVDYELIGKMIGEAVRAAVAPLYLNSQPVNREEKKALPAPVKADRDKLRQLVSEYAVNILDGDHQGAWHRLYAEIYYRCHKSVKVLAKNARISKLDMIERLGLLDEAVAILIEMMGE